MPKSHVPKFGNWENDSGPITAYFESACREKSGASKRIDPNDPEENTEAFKEENTEAFKFADRQRDGINHENYFPTHNYVMRKGFTNDKTKSLSDNSASSSAKRNGQCKRSGRNKYLTAFHLPPSPADELSCRSISVPKFGEWDGKDHPEVEGFTFIFNKVKKEKEILASKLRSEPIINNHMMTTPKKESKSKRCFCLF